MMGLSRVMNIFIYLIICTTIVIVIAKTTHKPKSTTPQDCGGVFVREKRHKRHVLMGGINRPYQLAAYHKGHQVFFSYNIGEDTQDTFGIAFVNEKDTMPRNVNGIKNGFALAVDQHSKKIYFGGSEGIYSADLTKYEGDQYTVILEKRDIWDLFYHNHYLYFIEFPIQRLHKIDTRDEEKKIIPHETITDKIYQFVIDGNGDHFFTTKDGVFEMKNNTIKAIPYIGPTIFRALEVNNKGVAYFCARDGIYTSEKEYRNLTKIANIKNIFGLTFDENDNIIYSNPHQIVKLLPHNC